METIVMPVFARMKHTSAAKFHTVYEKNNERNFSTKITKSMRKVV